MREFDFKKNETKRDKRIDIGVELHTTTHSRARMVKKHLKLPVLDLKQIRYETISGTALHEITLGQLETLRFHAPILIDEVVDQTFVRVLFDLMQ